MSLQLAAQHLASKGRGPDTQLVHMAPQEVAGLQALARAHGGTLTTNPDTGLPEAGFLSSILPAVVGAGLSMIPGVGPLMAAGIVGGGTALASGSLMKGITAGLGAYGGAGLAGGLAGVGAAAPEAVAGSLGVDAASGAGSQAAMLAAQNAGFGQEGLDMLASSAKVAAPSAAAQSALGAGLDKAVATPSLLANQMGGWGKLAQNGLMAASPVMADMMVPTRTQMPGGGPNPYNYIMHRSPVTPTPMPDPMGREQRYSNNYFTPYAEGGVTTPVPNAQGIEQRYATPQLQAIDPNMAQQPNQHSGLMGLILNYLQRPEYAFTQTPMQGVTQRAYGGPVGEMSADAQAQTLMANGGQMYAAGGVSHLGDYSDGGRLLRGPGDGVSDSIPATIANKRPARLADGEFVVPARVVSELGNGSTEAGARKLYAMMDRVQKARGKTVGKGKVAVNSRADKLLPA